jgi:hypothetical protein
MRVQHRQESDDQGRDYRNGQGGKVAHPSEKPAHFYLPQVPVAFQGSGSGSGQDFFLRFFAAESRFPLLYDWVAYVPSAGVFLAGAATFPVERGWILKEKGFRWVVGES